MIRIEDGDTYAEFTPNGAAVTRLVVPDRNGSPTDVVLGYAREEDYLAGRGEYFGAAVGRLSGRVSGSAFTLDGARYELLHEKGEAQLHGGPKGFSRLVWDCGRDGENVVFSLFSPDGDQGFPGNMRASVTYGFQGGTLSVEFRAVSDRDTFFAPTTHCYFNLDGHGSGPIGAHRLQLAAREAQENGADGLPTGNFIPVEGTALSFLSPRALADGMSNPHANMLDSMGYDHCYVLEGGGFRECAALASRESGIAMRVFTDMPCLVVYTANYMEPMTGKDGAEYDRYGGVCLEPGYLPDAVNHPEWTQPLLRAGEEFYSRTEYRFLNF